MLIPSDNAAANALLVRLGGSTSGGGALVNETMRAIGLERTEMYGGYILGTALGGSRDLAGAGVPLGVVSQPSWGIGKSTTALDLAQLFRAVWLSSGGLGPLARTGSGVTPAEARYLLYVLARVGDRGKLARTVGDAPGGARDAQGRVDRRGAARRRARRLARRHPRRRRDDVPPGRHGNPRGRASRGVSRPRRSVASAADRGGKRERCQTPFSVKGKPVPISCQSLHTA